MTIWEFGASIEGWKAAQGGEQKPEAMDDDEFDDMLKRAGYK